MFLSFVVDTATAMEALQLVNGYPLKGQPLIVQYGRQQRSDS